MNQQTTIILIVIVVIFVSCVSSIVVATGAGYLALAPPASSGSTSAPFAEGLVQYTASSPDGNGDATYLNQLNVDCGATPVNRFQLSRGPGAGTWRYSYNCSSGGSLAAPVSSSTNWADSGGGSVIFLDRQDVDCGANGVLTQFQLEKNANGQDRYNYSCAKSNNPLQCRQVSTNPDSTGGNSAYFLDRHDVACNPNEAMQQMQLHNIDFSTMQYNYTCCS